MTNKPRQIHSMLRELREHISDSLWHLGIRAVGGHIGAAMYPEMRYLTEEIEYTLTLGTRHER